jgi:hypothetical protein
MPGPEPVEIPAARDGPAPFIPAVPDFSVTARTAYVVHQPADQLAGDIKYDELDPCAARYPERDARW